MITANEFLYFQKRVNVQDKLYINICYLKPAMMMNHSNSTVLQTEHGQCLCFRGIDLYYYTRWTIIAMKRLSRNLWGVFSWHDSSTLHVQVVSGCSNYLDTLMLQGINMLLCQSRQNTLFYAIFTVWGLLLAASCSKCLIG